MSQTRDRRRRADLDLFVLALIESGISTPYEFQRAASLSQGATIPALQRLLESRLIRRATTGPRGRTDYRITPAGKKLLKTGWRDLLEDGPSGDLDADLRVALLALTGGEHRLARDFLKRSATRKLDSIATVEEPANPDSMPSIAYWYRELRSASTKELLKSTAATALGMAESLPRKITSGTRSSRRSNRR